MIPYMVGKLAPNSTHFTRGLVKYVAGRDCFRAVSSRNGDKSVTSPPPLQSLNDLNTNIFSRLSTPPTALSEVAQNAYVQLALCVSVMAHVTKRSGFVSTLRSSSVIFSKRSGISSGGRAARVMEFCAVNSNPPCPFFPPFSPPHSPLQYHR